MCARACRRLDGTLNQVDVACDRTDGRVDLAQGDAQLRHISRLVLGNSPAELAEDLQHLVIPASADLSAQLRLDSGDHLGGFIGSLGPMRGTTNQAHASIARIPLADGKPLAFEAVDKLAGGLLGRAGHGCELSDPKAIVRNHLECAAMARSCMGTSPGQICQLNRDPPRRHFEPPKSMIGKAGVRT